MDSVQYRAVVLNVFIMLTGKIAQREKKCGPKEFLQLSFVNDEILFKLLI